MNQVNKIRICLFLNTLLVIFIGFYITNFATNSKYFRFGPNDDFIFISVHINTYDKYISLLILIFFNDLIRVVVQELGEPVLAFTVYNPDKKIIDEFTKSELYFYSNSMYFVSNIRYIFSVLINITQLDIALFSVCVEQLVTFFTIYLLINEKKFVKTKRLININNNNNINNNIEYISEIEINET
jgi:hypothetical protein